MNQWQTFAAQAEKEVAEELEGEGWTVEQEPVYGAMRPDIVARSPQGTMYVFEIKARASGSATFSDLAQAKAYAHAVGQVSGGAVVKPVLATTLDVSQAMNEAAQALGVGVVSAPGQTAQGLAKAVLGSVKDSGQVGRPN